MMKVFTEKEISQYLLINLEAIDVVEEIFTSLAEGKVSRPPLQ